MTRRRAGEKETAYNSADRRARGQKGIDIAAPAGPGQRDPAAALLGESGTSLVVKGSYSEGSNRAAAPRLRDLPLLEMLFGLYCTMHIFRNGHIPFQSTSQGTPTLFFPCFCTQASRFEDGLSDYRRFWLDTSLAILFTRDTDTTINSAER